MPHSSFWLVRLSLLHLALGSTLGMVLLLHKALGLHPWLWHLRTPHQELLLAGFMAQLAFGVGAWILPRQKGKPTPMPGITILVLLNLGIVLVCIGALINKDLLLLAGRTIEIIALLGFVRLIWPRVRPHTERRSTTEPHS